MGIKGKVAACLEERDWSARKVAIKAGVPDTSFRSWLNGQNENIHFSAIAKIARAIGVSLDWLAADELPDSPIPDWAIQRPGAAILGQAGEDAIQAKIVAIQDQTEQRRRTSQGKLTPSPATPREPLESPPRTGQTGPAANRNPKKR